LEQQPAVSTYGNVAMKSDADLIPALTRRLTVLGGTGSVGAATLDVVRFTRAKYGEHCFPLEVITAHRNVARLVRDARELKPKAVAIGDPSLIGDVRGGLAGSGVEVLAGSQSVLEAAARPADLVMSAIVGAAGLAPTLAALKRGATVALANKECVVAAGPIFRRAAQDSKGILIPVDSEHNAAFQLLESDQSDAIEKVTLTASGGPFRSWSLERMEQATPEQAVSHPNWSMGAKISVDSATLMNKGLELIEAHILFALPPEKLDVIIHAQSVVHCLVSYVDGSTLAHLSAPDMRTPIAHALAWPRRMASPARRLDFKDFSQFTFEKPDLVRFPCLQLARACLQTGGAAPTILNAANEVAVEQFLNRRIGFLGIARTVERTLTALVRDVNGPAPATLEDVLALDGAARARAREECELAPA
jgi:1-deoxy-D-xylulose-5-phosphate reductoisomerase